MSRLPEPEDGAPKPGQLAILIIVVSAITALPAAFTEFPPSVDYANHLARYHIAAEFDSVDA